MEPVLKSDAERRYYNRTDVRCQVIYRPFKEEAFKDAVLINISETGVLIGTNEKLDLDTHLYLKIESPDDEEQPIQLLIETIRDAEKFDAFEYCYGCMILDVFY